MLSDTSLILAFFHNIDAYEEERARDLERGVENTPFRNSSYPIHMHINTLNEPLQCQCQCNAVPFFQFLLLAISPYLPLSLVVS